MRLFLVVAAVLIALAAITVVPAARPTAERELVLVIEDTAPATAATWDCPYSVSAA